MELRPRKRQLEMEGPDLKKRKMTIMDSTTVNDDCLLKILRFVPLKDVVASASLVCRQWKRCADEIFTTSCKSGDNTVVVSISVIPRRFPIIQTPGKFPFTQPKFYEAKILKRTKLAPFVNCLKITDAPATTATSFPDIYLDTVAHYLKNMKNITVEMTTNSAEQVIAALERIDSAFPSTFLNNVETFTMTGAGPSTIEFPIRLHLLKSLSCVWERSTKPIRFSCPFEMLTCTIEGCGLTVAIVNSSITEIVITGSRERGFSEEFAEKTLVELTNLQRLGGFNPQCKFRCIVDNN